MTPRERAEGAQAKYNRLWKDYEACGWVVSDKTTGEFIGHCEIQKELGEPELGFALGKRYWGRGIATEVARAATRFGFEVANLDRIRAVVDPENIASWKVLAKIGFQLDRKAARDDIEVVFYSITREDFEPGDSFYKVSPPATDS
jgi:ribosomal-protein-alanine N-acetyltransferase